MMAMIVMSNTSERSTAKINTATIKALYLAAVLCLFPLPVFAGAIVGQQAPPITIENLSNAPRGAKANWEALGDRTVVLEFWGTWCGPCVLAIPHLNELQEQFADEDVAFLSVTFETPDVIRAFLNARSMRSWVGHDLDESMVKAYGVVGWPTTFVVRNRKIVARLSPQNLTPERLRGYINGQVDAPVYASGNNMRADVVGRDGRPIINQITAGIDPFSRFEEPTELLVLIRKAGEIGGGTSQSGHDLTGVGLTIRQVIARVWQSPTYAVAGEAWLDESRYDVVWRIPATTSLQARESARSLVADAMGVRVASETFKVRGLAARVSSNGLTLPVAVGEEGGWGGRSAGNIRQITGASLSISGLLGVLSSYFDCPIRDDIKVVDQNFFVELKFPTDDTEAAIAAIKRQSGIDLKPVEMEVIGLRVDRNKQAKPNSSGG